MTQQGKFKDIVANAYLTFTLPVSLCALYWDPGQQFGGLQSESHHIAPEISAHQEHFCDKKCPLTWNVEPPMSVFILLFQLHRSQVKCILLRFPVLFCDCLNCLFPFVLFWRSISLPLWRKNNFEVKLLRFYGNTQQCPSAPLSLLVSMSKASFLSHPLEKIRLHETQEEG